MRGKEKAAAMNSGGGKDSAGGALTRHPHDSTGTPKLQARFDRHYSSLLDQALISMERHTRLARFHYRQASQHRQMKSYLESYLFGGDL